MKCNNCSVNIEYKTTKCPICGAQFDGDSLPEFFPKPQPLTKHKTNKISISFCALLTVLSICLVMLIVNLFTFNELAWSLIASACMLLLYFVFTVSFRAKYSLACRNFFTFSLTLATFYLIGFLTDLLPSTSYYILPNIFTLFTLVNFTALVLLDRQKYFFSTLFFAVIGVIPLILYAAKLPVSVVLTSVGASVSVLAIIVSIVLNFKNLKSLFSSYFHF